MKAKTAKYLTTMLGVALIAGSLSGCGETTDDGTAGTESTSDVSTDISTDTEAETPDTAFQGFTDDTESTDAEATDTEATDTEATDTEATDTETTDTEATDTEATDTEATDTEATDTETTDTKSTDTEATDTESTDAKADDAKTDDAKTGTTESRDAIVNDLSSKLNMVAPAVSSSTPVTAKTKTNSNDTAAKALIPTDESDN